VNTFAPETGIVTFLTGSSNGARASAVSRNARSPCHALTGSALTQSELRSPAAHKVICNVGRIVMFQKEEEEEEEGIMWLIKWRSRVFGSSSQNRYIGFL
jgi:hypothetical protein